jgi:ParB family chromosome partitioning protein
MLAPDMAKEAERLLEGSGWLPQPLRRPDIQDIETAGEQDTSADAFPAFLTDGGSLFWSNSLRRNS